jgi:large subunit ribosomal protein L19
MRAKIETFFQPFLKKEIPNIQPGDKVRVYQKIKETVQKSKGKSEEKERTQVFEGIVLARKHGKGINATFTVRNVIEGVGVERTFPLHSPLVEKIEIVARHKVSRAKLYYLREKSEKEIRKKLKPLK